MQGGSSWLYWPNSFAVSVIVHGDMLRVELGGRENGCKGEEFLQGLDCFCCRLQVLWPWPHEMPHLLRACAPETASVWRIGRAQSAAQPCWIGLERRRSPPFPQVEVDLGMNAWANARARHEARKKFASKQRRTVAGNAKAIAAAEKRSAEQLAKVEFPAVIIQVRWRRLGVKWCAVIRGRQ